MLHTKRYSPLTPWLIWGLAAFFFFAHYVVRVTPGQIIEQLQAAFAHTTKFDIGLLGAAFYLPYVIMQMPVGYLVDRFGSRLLLTIAVFVCSASCFIFAHAHSFDATVLSRILLGFCSATAFIGALKLITVWFEPQKLALLVGVTQALGMAGASAGNGLVPYLNDAVGWRNTFSLYAGVFLVLALLIYSFVRNRPQGKTAPPFRALPSSAGSHIQISHVLCNKFTWINALYAGLIYAPTDSMGELWGREFITHIQHTNANKASIAVSLLFVGWAIGGPIAGWLADQVGRRPVMLGSAIMGSILLPIIFYVPHLPLSFIMGIMFLYGLTNTGLIASYAAAGELHNKESAGFSMAIANMFSVLLGALLMPLLGWLLQLVGYQRATIVLPICTVLAIVCSLFVKETLKKDI